MNINTSAKSNKILGLKVDGRKAALQMKALRVVTSLPREVVEHTVSAFKTMKPELPRFPRL